jgi:acylphosphatase
MAKAKDTKTPKAPKAPKAARAPKASKPPKDKDIAIRVVIEGRVQGVGFRWWISEWANGRGLEGWVRNRREGTVEALFYGPESVVRHMVEFCAEGPPNARVRNVKEYNDESPDDPGFIERPTV